MGVALLENTDVPLGTPCPDFDLPRVDGGRFRLADAAGARALVVMFMCNHCPYVQAVEDRLIALAREYGAKGVRFVGICSNDPESYPDDAPAKLRARWKAKGYGFPYLVDETQDVARAFDAVCTPDIFVYGADLTLAYHGRIDDDWKSPERVRRRELAAALDALLAGERPTREQHHSMGCSIKWRPGS